MKLTVAEKFKSLLDVNEAAKGETIHTATAEVVAVNKKGTFISGQDGCQLPVEVELTDGESKLVVGDKITFQVETGVLVNRVGVKTASQTPMRSGSGSPDRSEKCNRP